MQIVFAVEKIGGESKFFDTAADAAEELLTRPGGYTIGTVEAFEPDGTPVLVTATMAGFSQILAEGSSVKVSRQGEGVSVATIWHARQVRED